MIPKFVYSQCYDEQIMPTKCVSVGDSQLFLSDPDQGGQLIMDPARFEKYCCQIGTGSKSLNLIKLNFFCNFLESLIYTDCSAVTGNDKDFLR